MRCGITIKIVLRALAGGGYSCKSFNINQAAMRTYLHKRGQLHNFSSAGADEAGRSQRNQNQFNAHH